MNPQEIVERTLSAATGLAGCAVIVSETSEAVLRWANSTMTTNGHTTSSRVTVVAVVDLPDGVAAGTVSLGEAVTDPPVLADLVAAAERSARDAGPSKDASPLPEAGEADPGWAEPGAATSIAVYSDLATGLAEVLAGPLRHFGFASHSLTTTWLGTSTGVRHRWVQPTGSVELNVKDAASSAWTGTATTDFTDVDVVALAAEAEARLAWGARKVTLDPGRYETVMPPSAVADMLVYASWSMEGRAAQEGRSAFSGKVGERLTDLPLTLYSDPAEPGCEYEPVVIAGGGTSVFDNGAPTRRVDWVREGAMHELQYTRAEAAEFGTTFTPAGDNLVLTGGSAASTQDLVARTGRGLLLTCLWYIREVDPATLLLTGLTRDGVYLVEDGEVVAEVDHNFRFNYSPLDMLRRTTEVGATAPALPREWKDWFTRSRMPAMRIPDFRMSSVSLGK
ncbi:metallopeptidase TldD-related protein [Pseudonocardia ailaonensis]|uniref:Metallopeptidase TldD-related protein n=1 Tax=Pseudonocardia ailaonensis TaxID=367279 RepID=A0ABN2NNZ4_9PSEU